MPGRVLSVFRDVGEVKKGRNWGTWMCNLLGAPSCFMRRRYAWVRCLFFEVMSGGELWFVAGFGKGWDKLGGVKRGGIGRVEWADVRKNELEGGWKMMVLSLVGRVKRAKRGMKWAKRRVGGRQHLPILRPQGLGGCKIPPMIVYKTYI